MIFYIDGRTKGAKRKRNFKNKNKIKLDSRHIFKEKMKKNSNAAAFFTQAQQGKCQVIFWPEYSKKKKLQKSNEKWYARLRDVFV